jgi:hypothetical protein
MGYIAFYRKGDNGAFAKAFSNRKVLAEYIGISYHTLTHHFVREGHIYHEYEEKGITVLRFEGIEKGRQRLERYDPDEHNRNI